MLVVLRVFMVSSSLINYKAPEFYRCITKWDLLTMRVASFANDVACEHWVDGLGLRLYLVYLLRDTLPSVDFELCSQSSSGIIESDFSV